MEALELVVWGAGSVIYGACNAAVRIYKGGEPARRHAAEIEQLKLEHEQDIAKCLKESFEEGKDAGVAKYKAEIEQLKLEHEQDIAKCLEESFEEGKDAGIAEYKVEIEQLKLEHEQDIARCLKESFAEGKDAGIAEYKAELLKQREEYPCPDYLPNDHIPTIGIMGESGVGKSTFINMLLGKCRAKTGISEQTKDPGLYKWRNLRVVDLPGGCTTKFKAEDYFQLFGIRYFDTIVCLQSDARVKELSLGALDHLAKNGIPTLFVLTKMDSIVSGEAMGNGKSEQEVIKEMDHTFKDELQGYGCFVFFISALEVLAECGNSFEAVPLRRNPLQRPLNRDWQRMLQVMETQATKRKKIVMEAKMNRAS